MSTPDTKPITITLQYCGCPTGAWRATAPRHGITANHDYADEALNELVRRLVRAGALDAEHVYPGSALNAELLPRITAEAGAS